MSTSPRKASGPDFATIGGLLLAMLGILGGLVLEKGKVQDVTQFTAALIVFGGTMGAVMVSTPGINLQRALRRGRVVFRRGTHRDAAVIDEVVHYATLARRAGIVSLDDDARAIQHPFLRKGVTLAVDGVDTQEIRRMLQMDIRLEEDRADADARVYESAGGYAPTIGIIGAVMGLIQVMKHLEDIGEVGKGIAVAFVATIYGVGLANLLLLPMAAKIRACAQAESITCELMLEGVIAIAEGLNPKLIREKLDAFLERSAAPRPGPQSVKAA